MTTPDYKAILQGLIVGIAVDYHKPAGDIFSAIKAMGIELPDYIDELDELPAYLGKVHGFTTLRGTNFHDPEYDDCKDCGRLKIECDLDYEYVGDGMSIYACEGAQRRVSGEDDD